MSKLYSPEALDMAIYAVSDVKSASYLYYMRSIRPTSSASVSNVMDAQLINTVESNGPNTITSAIKTLFDRYVQQIEDDIRIAAETRNPDIIAYFSIEPAPEEAFNTRVISQRSYGTLIWMSFIYSVLTLVLYILGTISVRNEDLNTAAVAFSATGIVSSLIITGIVLYEIMRQYTTYNIASLVSAPVDYFSGNPLTAKYSSLLKNLDKVQAGYKNGVLYITDVSARESDVLQEFIDTFFVIDNNDPSMTIYPAALLSQARNYMLNPGADHLRSVITAKDRQLLANALSGLEAIPDSPMQRSRIQLNQELSRLQNSNNPDDVRLYNLLSKSQSILDSARTGANEKRAARSIMSQLGNITYDPNLGDSSMNLQEAISIVNRYDPNTGLIAPLASATTAAVAAPVAAAVAVSDTGSTEIAVQTDMPESAEIAVQTDDVLYGDDLLIDLDADAIRQDVLSGTAENRNIADSYLSSIPEEAERGALGISQNEWDEVSDIRTRLNDLTFTQDDTDRLDTILELT